MQAANTLNYAVQQQKNNKALYVVFSFARTYNALTQTASVTQRIAHAVTSASCNATLAQIAAIVAKQQALDNAASVCCYTNSKVSSLLQKNSANVLA
jgi:hypothetical protein